MWSTTHLPPDAVTRNHHDLMSAGRIGLVGGFAGVIALMDEQGELGTYIGEECFFSRVVVGKKPGNDIPNNIHEGAHDHWWGYLKVFCRPPDRGREFHHCPHFVDWDAQLLGRGLKFRGGGII